MPRVWIATVLNFFLPGLGYLVLGLQPVRAALWLVALCGLTYVEFGIQPLDAGLYWTMFASVFALNTAFAMDVYLQGRDRLATA